MALDKEWYLKEARRTIDALEGVITQLEKEKAQLSFDFAAAKIEVPEPYVMPKTGTDFLRTDICAQMKADRLYEADKATRERNKPKYEANQKLRDALIALMKSLGFPDSVQERASSRSMKMVRVPAGWMQTVNTIPCFEGIGSSNNIDQIYQNWCRIIKDAEAGRKKVQDEKDRKRAAEEKDRARIRLLVELGVKYGTEFPDVEHAVDHILGKNKYLRLAYFLEKNRGDWSEGPDYAESGMRGFEIEPGNEKDAAISKEIYGLISDWGEYGDGRCFRDCTWNYSVLYGMVPEDLRADLAKLREYGA